MKSKKSAVSWLVDNLNIVIGIVAVGALILLLISCVCNEANRITEGVVIDKQYHAAYTTTSSRTVGDKTITIPRYVPERYVFTIQGEKNGQTVKYTFNVTSSEFEEYSIGDYFMR